MERSGLARINVEMNDPAALQPPSVSVGDYAKAIWEVVAAGAEAPLDRDLLTRAPGVLLGGGARGGREIGARRLGRVHGASGRVSGSSGPRSPRRPPPGRG